MICRFICIHVQRWANVVLRGQKHQNFGERWSVFRLNVVTLSNYCVEVCVAPCWSVSDKNIQHTHTYVVFEEFL